jgi:hypothetical protein
MVLIFCARETNASLIWRLQSDDGFEFFIRKYETLLGRRSSSAQADVVLGDNMNTSRKHASITYNFEKGASTGPECRTAVACRLHFKSCLVQLLSSALELCGCLAGVHSNSRGDECAGRWGHC